MTKTYTYSDVCLKCVSPPTRSHAEAAARGTVFALTWREKHGDEWAFCSKKLGTDGRLLVGADPLTVIRKAILPGGEPFSIIGGN